jgi:large subunit ribosomal protein L24|eukprot:g4991.t1
MASRPLAGRIWKRTLKEKRLAKDLVKRWNIVTGDMVQVISGKDRGKQGEVLRVNRKLNFVYVEGAALRHTSNSQGAELRSPGAIHYSNVQLVDPETGSRTKVNRRIIGGEKVRVASATGNIIDKPTVIDPSETVKPDEKTTAAKYVLEKTYVPPDYENMQF